MNKSQLIVLSNAVAGCDTQFNSWYDEVHLGDVLKVPGVVGARRFALESDKWRYLAIYDLESEDPAGVIDEILARAGTDAMPLDDAFDMSTFHMALARPLTP